MLDFLKRLYAIDAVERGVWTLVEFAAGAAAMITFDNAVLGGLVALVILAAKEAARAHLGK